MKNAKLQTVISIASMIAAGAVLVSGAVLVQNIINGTEQIETSDFTMEEAVVEYNTAPGVLVVNMAALAPIDDFDAYIAAMEGEEAASGSYEYLPFEEYTLTSSYSYQPEDYYTTGPVDDFSVPIYSLTTAVPDESVEAPVEETVVSMDDTTAAPIETTAETTTTAESTTTTKQTEQSSVMQVEFTTTEDTHTSRATVTTTSAAQYETSERRTVPTQETTVYVAPYEDTSSPFILDVTTPSRTSDTTTSTRPASFTVAYTTTTTSGAVTQYTDTTTTMAPVITTTTTTTTKATTITAKTTAAEDHTTKPPFINIGGGVWQSDLNIYNKMLKLLNAARAEQGLDPLTYSLGIQNVCKVRCEEISGYYSHQRPDGSKFSTAFKDQGISYSVCGENIAYGRNMFKTVEEVFQAWMDSPSHYANIMNQKFTHCAFGLCVLKVNSDTYYYWAQEFAGFTS